MRPSRIGSAIHVEYWTPDEQLRAFNAAIRGLIGIGSAYFGMGFKGFIRTDLAEGKGRRGAIRGNGEAWDYSRMDFVSEVSINRKAVYRNFLFWSQLDS